MALSGVVQKQVGTAAIYTKVEWSATQNSAARTSTITAKLYLESTGGTLSTSNNRNVKLVIGGLTKTGTANFTLRKNQKKLLMTYERTIKHEEDGSLNLTISGTTSFNGLIGYGDITASGIASLNNIGAVDLTTGISLNKSEWKFNTPLSYVLDRKKSSHDHRIEIRVNGTLLKTIPNAPLSGSLPGFDSDETAAFFRVLNGRTDPSQLTMDVRVYTYDGSTLVGSRSAQTSIRGLRQTETYNTFVSDLNLRDTERTMSLYMDTDLPKSDPNYYTLLELYGYATNIRYGMVYADHSQGNVKFNLGKRVGGDFSYEDLVSATDRRFVWKVSTYYKSEMIGTTHTSKAFNISLDGSNLPPITKGYYLSDPNEIIPGAFLEYHSSIYLVFKWGEMDQRYVSYKVQYGYDDPKTGTISSDSISKTIYLGTAYSSYDQIRVELTDAFGAKSITEIPVPVRKLGTPYISMSNYRVGTLSQEVKINISGIFDSLDGINKVTKITIYDTNHNPIDTSFTVSGNRVSVSSSQSPTLIVPISSSDSISAVIEFTYGEPEIIYTHVESAKPLFFIDSRNNSLGLGKIPEGGDIVDSDNPIIAPEFRMSPYHSLKPYRSDGFRFVMYEYSGMESFIGFHFDGVDYTATIETERNYIDLSAGLGVRADSYHFLGQGTGYIDGRQNAIRFSNSSSGNMEIVPTSSYIQFNTSTSRYYFDKEVVAESTFRSSGNATFNSSVSVSRDLSVSRNLEVNSRLDVEGDAAVTGHFRTDRNLTVGWGASFGDEITVSGRVVANTYDIANGVSYTRSGNSPVVRGGEASSIIYLQAGTEVRAVKPLTTGNYIPVRASSHPTASSILYKQNVEDLTETEANRLLDSLHVKTYHLNSDIDAGIYDKVKIGLINEMSPKEVRDEDGIDSYSVASLAIKQVQIQKSAIEDLERRIRELEKLI